jgi:transposase
VPKPATLEACHEVIAALIAQLATQAAQFAGQLLQMEIKVADLQERARLNSRNSSKPPSSDGPGAGGSGNRAQRRASERNRGAQKGHPGSFRPPVDESQVDTIVECAPPAICECGAPVHVTGKALRHQVFDIPAVQAHIDEYRLYSGCCTGCGKVTQGGLPAGVPRGQIGPHALACIGTLGTRYHLTQGKVRDLLAQMLGVDFSIGAISQAHGKVAAALAAPVREARDSLRTAPVVHMDETNYPREGTTSGHWVWGVVQPKLAVFSIGASRARYVAQDLIGLTPKGVVVSDRYAAYAFIDAKQRPQVVNIRQIPAVGGLVLTCQSESSGGSSASCRPCLQRLFTKCRTLRHWRWRRARRARRAWPPVGPRPSPRAEMATDQSAPDCRYRHRPAGRHPATCAH